jgi:hypothetical protein
MTEAEWLAGASPEAMWKHVHAEASGRKLHLLRAAICHGIWHLLSVSGRVAAEAAERYADGRIPGPELAASYARVEQEYLAFLREHPEGQWGESEHEAAEPLLLSRTVFNSASSSLEEVVCQAAPAARLAAPEGPGTAWHGPLLTCLFGNPFRPAPAIDPALLAWNAGTVRALAEVAYEERRLPEGTLDPARLALLADALEDAGCGEAELLAHFRSPWPHVRGCWALDLILGRE